MKNRAYSKFLTVEKASAKIDETKVAKDAKFDGKYAIRTNSSLSDEEAALAYKELWRVEQSFRNLKSGLEIRPMYHRNESRIRRHIMVCFLALVLESFLAYKLKEIGCKESVKDILHDVSQIKASLITVNGEDQIVRTELSGEANAAFVAIGTQAPPRVLADSHNTKKMQCYASWVKPEIKLVSGFTVVCRVKLEIEMAQDYIIAQQTA